MFKGTGKHYPSFPIMQFSIVFCYIQIYCSNYENSYTEIKHVTPDVESQIRALSDPVNTYELRQWSL